MIEREQLTGWQLGYNSGFEVNDRCQWSMPLDLPENELGHITLEPGQQSSVATALEDAQPMAQAIGQVLGELQRTRHAVWRREADLATAIPVAIRADDQQSLAIRMEAVLQGGAEAIGLGDSVGALVVGMRADIIQVSFDDVHFVPTYDVISHLVYVADEQDVSSVVVDGKVLMKNREMLTINTERVKKEATALAARIQKALYAE